MKRLAILSFLLAGSLLAQEPATITIRKGDTTSVALHSLGGDQGAPATKILQNDLDLSGWFSVTPPERATYIVGGSINGGTLAGQVTDQRGSIVLQKTYSGGLRAAVHKYADDIVNTLTGQKGIASSKIAFVSNRTGRKEIYVADYDGANVQQLTKDNVLSVAPALSPDGSKLAYTGYLSGYADIYLVNLANGARNRIIKFPGTNSGASFSPDGSHIACTLSKDGNPELYVLGDNGGGAHRLTHTSYAEASPCWSPDGSEILYTADPGGKPQLYRIGVGGGTGQLISTGYDYCTEPSWSPDGHKVAFTARTGGFSIAIKDLSGGASQLMASGQDPDWGADSRHLIFSNGEAIILLDTHNGRQVPVISNLGKVSEPSWSR